AAGLELSIDDLAAAAADDQVLMTVLAVQASQARRFDLLARLVREGAPDAWSVIIEADGFEIPPESVADWSRAAIQPDLWVELPISGLMRLYEKLRHPLPRPVAERLLASKVWRDTLSQATEKLPHLALFSSVAILVPAPVRAALRRDLAP